MRRITGKELDKAILKSQGKTWDGMPIPKLKVRDLKTNQGCNTGILQRSGKMSEGLDSTDKLFMKHSSKSYNPKLANFFHERND